MNKELLRCDGCGRILYIDIVSSCITSHIDLEYYGMDDKISCTDDQWYCKKCLNKLGFCKKCNKNIPIKIQKKIIRDYELNNINKL